MTMWLRIGGALLITLAVMAILDSLGVSSFLSGRTADQATHEAHGRARELFWMVIFTVVMATALLAALRRWAGHLRRAVATPQLKRRDMA